MRIIFIFIFLILKVTCVYSMEKVRIGIFNLPPYMMAIGPDKKPGGSAIDYWKQHIAPKMNVEVEVSGPFPILRVVKMLEQGEVDVITNMTKIPERESMFIYPETNMSEISSCLVVSNDSPINKITDQEDLLGLRIGFIEGGYLPSLLRHPNIKFELSTQTNYQQILTDMLMNKRVDALLNINYISCLYDLSMKGYRNKVRVILLPVERTKVYSIFRKSEKGKRLAKRFDKANILYYKTDIYDNLAKKYLNK